ncbi:hypothetical protein CDL12_02653 [Handroanthus impetiginosus]|uniref:Uncharacterized protein n=1 Tax=Handroanthus impetiginosus TaxID=429701 RepID=A0A2G9I4E4_9LAMI|nr:hypothetical protein CDL12_02653 [Handroanthus impetiginosus]
MVKFQTSSTERLWDKKGAFWESESLSLESFSAFKFVCLDQGFKTFSSLWILGQLIKKIRLGFQDS